MNGLRTVIARLLTEPKQSRFRQRRQILSQGRRVRRGQTEKQH